MPKGNDGINNHEKDIIKCCMQDPGPCGACGHQTSLMYAVFTRGKIVNGYYESSKRISKPLCQECIWKPNTVFEEETTK